MRFIGVLISCLVGGIVINLGQIRIAHNSAHYYSNQLEKRQVNH